MPIVRVELREGKSPEYIQTILEGVHGALVDSFKIPDHDRVQLAYELPARHFEVGDKSENLVVVTIMAFAGRSMDAKRKLYKGIVDRLEKKPGISGNDVIIVLLEQPMDCWGIRGGKPASEIDLGFDVNV